MQTCKHAKKDPAINDQTEKSGLSGPRISGIILTEEQQLPVKMARRKVYTKSQEKQGVQIFILIC